MTRTRTRRWVICTSLLALATACGGSPSPEQTTPDAQSSGIVAGGISGSGAAGPDSLQSGGGDGTDAARYVQIGEELKRREDCRGAITQGFDPALRIFESRRQQGVTYRAVRPAGGSDLQQGGGEGVRQPDGTVRVGALWPDTYFLKAYCQIELRDLHGAERSLRAALELIPNDPVYLAELAFIYVERRDWNTALRLYTIAQASADRQWEHPEYGPTRDAPQGATFMHITLLRWRTRTRRGVGFVLIELNRLDEAQRIFEECLRLDPNDRNARQELREIEERRARAQGPTFQPSPQPAPPSTAGSI